MKAATYSKYTVDLLYYHPNSVWENDLPYMVIVMRYACHMTGDIGQISAEPSHVRRDLCVVACFCMIPCCLSIVLHDKQVYAMLTSSCCVIARYSYHEVACGCHTTVSVSVKAWL